MKERTPMSIDISGFEDSHTVDSGRWPDVAAVPSGPLNSVSAVIADRLFRRAAARLPVRLRYPDGTVVGAADPTLPTMTIHRPDALARRIGRYGLIGFGESYMAGDWTSADLAGVLTAFAKSMAELVPPALQRFRRLAVVRAPRSQHNHPTQARANVSAHYDLSNDLFAEFLDDTMTYSSALFGHQPATWANLPAAQHNKIDKLLDAAGVRAGSEVLEIGTGWGELCIRAAGRGAHVRSVTLSVEQQHLAQRRVAAAGLSDRVSIELLDYRAVQGQYDAVISVEMIEAVGYRFWPTYFQALNRLVRPGCRVSIQAITMPHDRMLASRHTYTWIQKYIFPGGLLPSEQAIADIAAQHTDLRTVDVSWMGQDYAETLRLWRERFLDHREAVRGLGFDDVFVRMWELYLAYSEAGFRAGYLDVVQWTFVPAGEGNLALADTGETTGEFVPT
jgi:cyclopropane-fatty-acyl-phospholipid synthase